MWYTLVLQRVLREGRGSSWAGVILSATSLHFGQRYKAGKVGLCCSSCTLVHLNCYFCLCRLGVSSLDALRSGILVGCWTTSWPPNCTAQAVWPTSHVQEACPTNSITSSLGPQTVSMRVWPLAGTGESWESSTVELASRAACMVCYLLAKP